LPSSRAVYVLDATAIIHFAKIQKLCLLLAIGDFYITAEVYKETVERGKGRPDATVIRDAVESGQLKVHEVRNRSFLKVFQRHPEIHLGEAETLAAAKELNAFAVVDEAEARAIANCYGVMTRTGTIFLLFKLLSLRQIKESECERILDELVKSGLYIDSQTLIRAKQKIKRKGLRHGR